MALIHAPVGRGAWGFGPLGILRMEREQALGELVHHPEGEPEWQRGCPLRETWEARKVIPGHPEAICCLFLPQAGQAAPQVRPGRCRPRGPDESFQQMASSCAVGGAASSLRGCHPRWLGPCAFRGLGKILNDI